MIGDASRPTVSIPWLMDQIKNTPDTVDIILTYTDLRALCAEAWADGWDEGLNIGTDYSNPPFVTLEDNPFKKRGAT